MTTVILMANKFLFLLYSSSDASLKCSKRVYIQSRKKNAESGRQSSDNFIRLGEKLRYFIIQWNCDECVQLMLGPVRLQFS